MNIQALKKQMMLDRKTMFGPAIIGTPFCFSEIKKRLVFEKANIN